MHLNRQGTREYLRVVFKRPRFLRMISTLTTGVAFVVFRTLTWMTRGLDRVLYPELKDQKVEQPIFIVANPRSGTTLLHRLLSLDEERFATMTLYQTVLHAVCTTKFFRAIGRFMDTTLGAPLRWIYELFNAPFASRWQGVHEMDLSTPEEDEAVFVLGMHSCTTALLMPFIDDMQSMMKLDKCDPEERQRFMDYYEETVKRVVYASGGKKRFLNKNVFFSPRIRTMYERFPDATFVYLVRNPCDALPSYLNMFYRAWQSHSRGQFPLDSREFAALVEMGVDWYRYALSCREVIPPEQFVVIRYEDLVSDLRGTVERLYRRLGLEMSDEFVQKLEECVLEHQQYERPASFTLEDFGLTRYDVYRELREVFREFGYKRPPFTYAEAAE